jgi:hypothetical protein
MSFADALAADRAGEIELAAARYEEALAAGDRSLPVLLNLALLYWQATDPGLSAAKRFTTNFLAIAGHRIPELLEEAIKRFPSSTSVRFWQRYIAWADLGEALDKETCRALLREDPTVLVPAMYLFSASQGAEGRAEAAALLHQARSEGTTGARYVVSVLEAAMKRTGQ